MKIEIIDNTIKITSENNVNEMRDLKKIFKLDQHQFNKVWFDVTMFDNEFTLVRD